MARTDSRNSGDDESERELIDAEFQSMVAGLSLDESAPTTFLDQLDAIDETESDRALYAFPLKESKTLKQKFASSLHTIKSWWSKSETNESDHGDGAQL